MKLLDVSTPAFPGKFAEVDDADFARLSKWKWSIYKDRNTFYVLRKEKGRRVRLHHEVIGRKCMVDHKDGNGLNNRRANLRGCTSAQNACNRRKQSGSSKFKGVTLHKATGKWLAQIGVPRRHLGLFGDETLAAKAYDAAAKEMFGEFAWLNFSS